MADTNNPNPAALKWLQETWTSAFQDAVSALAGELPSIEWPSSETTPSGTLNWEQTFSAPAGARVWICAPEAAWSEVGDRVLRGAGMESPPEERRSTWLEIVQQAVAGVARALTAKLGFEVNPEPGREIPTIPQDATFSIHSVAFPGGPKAAVVVGWSPQLFPSQPRPAPGSAPEEAAPLKASVAVVQKSKTFDLLLDVEMPVSVSFGRAHLPLKDVVKLTTGSIVELNRSVTEPVEVIVNNCVIARGEVVVIEGNYGVRINQIISRQERLRTLR